MGVTFMPLFRCGVVYNERYRKVRIGLLLKNLTFQTNI